MAQKHTFPEELPTTQGDVASIIAEMETLRVFFEVGQGKDTLEAAVNSAANALALREADQTLEDRLATFCMLYVRDGQSELTLPDHWSKNPNPVSRAVEDLSLAWVRWVCWHDAVAPREALFQLDPSLTDRSVNTLAIQFWGLALDTLTQQDIQAAAPFFEKAMLVSSSFGLISNSPICWTYATSALLPLL